MQNGWCCIVAYVLTPQRVVDTAKHAIWIVHPFEFFWLWME